MTTITVTKQFQFDAAHYLPAHNGKCKSLHGHTYTAEISIRGPIKLYDRAVTSEAQDSDVGMVCDFGDMKAFWKESCDPLLDHQLLNESLANPTAERIANMLYNRWADWAAMRNLECVRVKLHETPTSYVEVIP